MKPKAKPTARTLAAALPPTPRKPGRTGPRSSPSPAAVTDVPIETPTDTAASELASLVAGNLGRALKPNEIETIRLIDSLFARIRSGTALTLGHLAELGFLITESAWQKPICGAPHRVLLGNCGNTSPSSPRNGIWPSPPS